MRRYSFSRPAKWRIATLVLVHLLIAAHIIHWKLAGTSLASIQLSDAGRFAAEGVATAAFVLFTVLVLATLVFGRFFCAWGCHMLALQELCRLGLQRIGIRPKLIRSRVLLVVPFYAAFTIYLQPVCERLWLGQPFPTPRFAPLSANLWAALPGRVEAPIIVLLGLLMIYLLGGLSFCKYVCPYGAVFALADTLALGRIRLTGVCDGCGRCTAACTTGVRVHAEVQQLGMVASSGCMRCFECVSACPHQVLAYRFGRPALSAPRRFGLNRSAFAPAEEAVALIAFTVTFLALNGVYDAVPLLLAAGAGVVASYVAVLVLRAGRQPALAIRGIALKQSGHWMPAGVVFLVGVLAVGCTVGHSSFIQYHQWRATAALRSLGFPGIRPRYLAADAQQARAAAEHLDFCSRYGLADTVDWNMKLAWLGRILAEPQRVEHHLRRAIALDPAQPAAHFNLGKELVRQGRGAEAQRAFAEAVRLEPSLGQFVPAISDRARREPAPGDADFAAASPAG